jgi:MarR family transcriptional regulator, organic hydroperoxide resistance regulator
MSYDKSLDIEDILFSYIDQFKFLFFPDKWSSVFLDYSKNEILVLLFLYRNKTANMTEISEYINAPLNTTTGVINRLEKKEMAERIRSNEDRRIVQIVLTENAKEFINKEKEIIGYYFKRIYEKLTEEEKTAALSIFSKVVGVLQQGKNIFRDEEKGKTVKRITIE